MKHPKFFLSTLFAAAALSVAPAVPALADGDGTSSSPLSGSISNLNPDSYTGTSGVVYINGITGGNLANGTDDKLTIKSNIDISGDGMKFTDAYSSVEYTFTGTITGNGNWTYSHTGAQKYVFTGSLAGYSGNIDIEFGGSNDRDSYVHFGEGGQAATDTNVSGTGSITLNLTGSTSATGSIVFNYGSYADSSSQAIAIGNSSLTADTITFTGSVNYTVSSTISGRNSSSTLTISNSGYTTTLKGNVSVANITVSSGSTLAFDGSVSIGGAISNSGTVTLNEDVIFVLDDMSFTGNWSTGATYTLISGGTIQLDGTTLTSSSTLSFNTDNLYVAEGTITSATFNYDGSSLTVTVIGDNIVEGINGDGSADNPYFTYGTATNVNIFTGEGTTVYIATDTRSFGDANSNTYWSSGGTVACNIVIGKAGIYLTNGSSSQVHNFTGSISGEGSWTVTSGTVAQHYGFTGDLSGWSGDFTISTSNAYDYAVFGGTIDGANSNGTITGITGAKAATNESVSGKGAISVDYGVVEYVYTTGAGGTTGETLTVTNTSIEAHQIIFDGGVNYNVSSDLKGWDNTSGTSSSDSTLTISTTGTVTVTGSISNFDAVVVNSGSTLALSGSVDLSSAIQNSGTVALNESVIFALDDLSYTGDWNTGATYTLVEGGTIQLGDTTLTSGGTISLGIDNLYTLGTITSATFNYDGGSLTVTITGEEYLEDGLHGDGTAGSPYFTSGTGNTISFNVNNFTEAGTTVYLATDSHSLGAEGENIYWSTSVNAACDIVIGAAGIYLTNGTSSNVHTFSGKISGTGNWTVGYYSASQRDVTQQYVFTGDLSEWSGDFAILTNTEDLDYIHYGNGGTAATNTSVSGTGSITVDFGEVQYNYSGYASGGTVLTVTNKSIEAHGVTFAGSVNYEVSADLRGWDGEGLNRSGGTITEVDSTLTISTSGTVTVTGSISNFDNIVVENGSTLVLSGTVDLSSAIQNSGAVTVNSDTVFVLDDLTGGVSGTYTLISGGTINGWTGLTSANFSTDTRATITVGSNGTITYTSGAASLVWNGSSGAVWQLDGDNVWLNGSSADSFYNDDTVTFNSGTGSSTVTVSGTVKPGSITVNGDYTFTVASGDTALIDTSTLTIANGATLTIDKGVTIYFDIGTVTAFSISGIAGTGTLEFEFNSDYTSTVNLGTGSTFAGEIYITSGNVQLESSAIGSGSFRLVSGVNAQVSSNNAQISGLIIEGSTTLDKLSTYTGLSITSLVLEDSSTLVFNSSGSGTSYNPSNSNQGLSVGTLTVSGSSATIQTSNWQNYVGIGTLVGTGATLTLGSNAASSVASIYELGGSNTSSQFTGRIVMSDTASGSNRGSSLVISDAYVAAGAVIEFGSENSTTDALALGVNASTVEIAGLVSSNSGGDIIYSGYISMGATLGDQGATLIDYSNQSGYGSGSNYDGVGVSTNTLVINVASGESYSFSGVILDKVNIEKKGSGTQSIEFKTGEYQTDNYFDGSITVSAGTLKLSTASGVTITTGKVSVASDATLDLSSATVDLSSAISNSGTVIVDTSTIFVLDGLIGGDTTEGTTYTIISGGTIIGWDDLTDSNFVADSRVSVTVGTGNAAGTITLVAGVAADLIWDATVDMVWDRTTKNWLNNGAQDRFAEHDSVTFTSTGQGTVTVESEGVIANIVTVASGTYSFTGGDITVTDSFVISSGAEVDYNSGDSIIYGDVVVSGTLKLNANTDGGYSGVIHGTITIDDGGWVEFNASDVTGYAGGYDPDTGVTAVTINEGGTLYVGTTDNQTLGGCTLTLVGGTITGVENSNIDLYTNSSVVVRATSDATAENPTVSTVTNTTLTPRNTDYGTGITEFDIGENAVLKVESGIMSGTGGAIYNTDLTKTGTGTLEVTGIFALNQGKLSVEEGSVVLEGTTIATTPGWGWHIGFASAVTISEGASLEMNLSEDTVLGYYTDVSNSDSFVGSCSITGSGNFTKSGSTTLTVSNYGVTGSTTVAEGTLILSGDSTIGGTVTIAGTLSVASDASLTIESTLGGADSTGTVTFAESSKLIISDSFLGSGIEITVDADGTTSVTSSGTITVIEANTVTFGSSSTVLSSDTLDEFISDYVSSSSNYTLEWAYSNGALTATITDVDVKTYLLPTTPDSSSSPMTSDGVMAAGYYIIDPRDSNTSKQGWMAPLGTTGTTTTLLSFEEGSFFYGEGLFGITVKVGSGYIVETIDLTNVDASNLTGQLIVMNEWNNELDVRLLGESWANVEFLFGNAVDDETLATKYGLTDTGLTRGDLGNAFNDKTLEDILALQGDTTLAGVTGATKGATTHGTDNVDVTLCDHETITVASNGTTLTIAGSDEYSFWGTVGTNSNRATISMTGSGTQTFGGTNYLQHVYVSNGNLIIAGNADVASTTTVSGGTLTVGCSSDDAGQSVSFNSSVTVQTNGTLAIAGTVYFSEVVSNSGTVTIDADSATFVVDNLTKVTVGDTSYYEIISNSGSGSIDVSGGSLSISNFSGEGLSGRWAVYNGSEGLYIYMTTSEAITWGGTEELHTWTNDESVLDWLEGSEEVSFFTDAEVRFTDSAEYKTVSVVDAVRTSSVTVTAEGYIFEFEDNGVLSTTDLTINSGASLTVSNASITATNLTVSSGAILELAGGAGTLTATTATIAGSISLGDGTTLDLSSIDYGFEGIGNITGTGTLVVAGVDAVGTGFTLDDEFTGTLSIASGGIDVCASVTNATTFELAGDTSLYVQTDSTVITQNISFVGDSGTVTLKPSNATGVVISGAVTGTSGVTIQKNGGGDITFTGTVNIAGTYHAYQGTTTFAGDSTTIGSLDAGNQTSTSFTGKSASIGTLNFNNAGYTVEFSGGGTYTVGTMSVTQNSTLSGTVTITDASRTGGTLLTITEGSDVTITGTFVSSGLNAKGNTTALEKDAKLTVATMTNAWGANFTLAEGSVFSVSNATFSSGTTACSISGSGTFIVGTLAVSNYANYTFDGITLIADTITLGSNTDALTFTGGGNFTVGTMTDTATNVNVNIGEDTTLNVTGSMGFGTGSASGSVTKVTGAGADTSTLVVGELDIGTNNGVSVQMTDLTLVVGSFVNGSSSSGSGLNFYLYLQDSTLGFTKDVTIATHSGGSTSRIVLGTKSSSSFSPTEDFSTVTINTSKYDTDTGSFSATEGVTVTISETIIGGGALIVDGVGKLTLSGANTFEGGVTLAGGTLAIGSTSALGTGTLTICEGTTLASASSGTITLTGQSFVIDGSSTFSGIVLAGEMTFDWAAGAVISMTDSASVTGTGTVTFADDTDFTYDGVILFKNTGLSANTDLSGWTAIYTGEGYDSFDGTFSVDSNGNIIFVANEEYLDVYGSLVWNADSTKAQTWAGSVFQGTEISSTDRNYLFNEKSTGATSTLSGEIKTNRVTIAGGAEEITWTTETASTSISGTDLNIEIGATLKFTPGTGISDFALNFTNINLSGALVYAGAAVTWETVTFGYNTASLTLSTTDAVTITNLVADADGAISSTSTGALTIANLSGSSDVDMGGSLSVYLGDISNYSGTINLGSHEGDSVTLTLAGSSNTYEFADVTIVVGTGGTLDANGKVDIGFNTVLAGGTLTSSSSIGNNNIQFPTITLTADSSVEAASGVSFGMVARNYGESDLYLNGNTLTKTGDGTFFLLDTTISGAGEEDSTGTIKIEAGTLELDGVTVNDTAIVVESGGKLYIASAEGYSSTTLDNLTSSGTVEIGGGATLTLVSDTTLTGALVIDNNGTLSVTNGAVVDITEVTSQEGGTGALSISGEGSTIKIANGAWGSSSNFGSSMYNGTLQIADGGILEVTAAQSEGTGSGERAFAVTSGTGTYRYSGEGASYIHSTERNIHLADDATLVFEVTNSDATLNVSMEIANGMSTSEDVLSSATTSTGSIEKTGAGKLILSGSNLYSGGTKISAGTLEATNTSALGTGAVEIAEGASLTLNAADGTFNLAGVSGAGSLTISAGTLATSSFTLSGSTTISTGATLALSATSDVATSSDITVEEGAYLTIDTGSYSTSFSGTVSGSGTLSKSGSGTLTLTDNVTVTNIAMSAGTLAGLALSDGMTATITGGTLAGFSMTGGELVISESGSTSITGNVTLSGGSISMTEAFDSTTPYFTVASGVTVTISGSVTFNLENLVLSGTDAAVVIFDSGVTFDNDITTDDLILNYGGSGGDPHFNPDDMGFVYDETSGSLSATLGLQSVELYWEGSTETGGNILAAEGAQNLHDANNTYTFFLAGDTIYFDGDKVAVSEVTLGSDIEAVAIYVQNGADITLDSDNGTYALTGEGTLSVAEGSSLTLKNARHSYTGETTVNGSLTLGITSDSGQLFASLVSGSGSLTLDIASDLTISIADNLTGDGDQLVAGSLTFIKSGDGTLVVDAKQTDFTGEVQIMGGTMVIAETGLFGDSTSITIDEDGTLEITASIDSLTETLTGAGTLLVDGGLTLTTDASKLAGFEGTTMLGDGATLSLSNTSETEVTVGTAITGSNATLVKTGSGTVNLASGTTVTEILVSAGTLGNIALTDGMTLATTQGTTISSVSMTGGTLTAAKGTTISGITMTGGKLDASNVFDDPTDSITLSGSNSFSGGTVLLGEGTLIDETTGEPVEPVVSAFIISSDSSVSVSDSIVFSIDNVELPDAVFDDEGKRIYTISYQVFDTSSGTLSGWTDLIYSNFAIDGVVLSGSERARVEISSDGSVKFYLTDYDLTWNGGESGVWNTSDVVWTRDEGVYTEAYDNGDSVTFTNEFGKLNITLGGDVNPMTLTVAEGADVTINGGEYKITGSKTTIVIEDNGKLTLTSGGNDFGGGVTINDGGELALKVSSNEAYLDGVTISLAENASGTFTIDTDANVTYETIFTGTLTDSENLTLVKDGSGTLTITSELGYESLDLEVKSGTLKIATEGSVGSVDIKLSGSANLELENTDAENSKTISNSISGVGSATTIVKTGEGEIIIDGGDNSGFSGSVEIYEGTLTLTSTDALGNVAKTTIAEDGTLKLDIGGDLDLANISGTVAGSGTIEINLGDNGTIYASSGYYGSGKFTDFTGSFVIDSGTEITMEVDVSSTSRGSAIGDANVELGEGVNLVFNIQSAGYSYGGSISGKGTVSFNWDSTSAASHTFSLTGDNSGFSGTIEIASDIVLTAKGTSLGSEDATVDNSGELWIDEDATSTVVAKLTGSGSLHKTGSGAVKIENGTNDLSGSLEIREGTLCFKYTDALGNISTASVSEGAVLEVEVDDSDNVFNVVVTGEGAVVIHGEEGSCIVPYSVGTDGYSTDQITLASNDSSSYNGGLTIDSAYLITSKTSSLDSMNELGTSTVTITNDSTWDASSGGFTASGSRTINIQKHSRLLAGAFKAESGYYGSISISNIRIDTNAADAADLYISVTSSSDITRNYITGTGDGKIYMTGVDIYLDTTITSFGQITVIDTSNGLEIVGTPSVYINGELEAESYWINGVISQDSISEDVKKNGLSYAAMVVMPTEAFNQDVRTIHSRLEQRRFAFSREGDWEFFAQAQTIQEDSGSSSDSKSFDYYTYGAIVGADVRIDQTTIFGMALAYDHGDAKIHHSQGHIKMDDYRFTAFGSKVFANWLFVEGGVQAGVGSYDIRRRAGSTVGDNNGDTDGVNVGGFFNFGGVVPITDNIFLTPYIGFTYMYSHVDSFDEEGSYGYKADGFDANSLRGKIGTQVRAELMLGDTPTALALGLSYAHEFIDDDIDYDVAAINYSDKKQSLTENAFTEDLISIGLSAEFGLTDAASVFMGYNADIGLGNSEVSHAVNAGVKVTF